MPELKRVTTPDPLLSASALKVRRVAALTTEAGLPLGAAVASAVVLRGLVGTVSGLIVAYLRAWVAVCASLAVTEGHQRAKRRLYRVVPVPNAGATAAQVNLTAVDPTEEGFLTAWPCGTAVPLASIPA